MAGIEGLTPAFAKGLQQLVAASGGRLRITSGFRSVQRQQQLFDAAVKKYGSVAKARKWVAPPGKSNHNHGNAADLSGDLDWAHANAGRFGLTFPLPHEKWHIELAGVRGAKAGHTHAPTVDDELYDENPTDVLETERLKDPMVQVANLFAILASEAPETGEYV